MPKSLLIFCFLLISLITTAQDSLYWQKVSCSNKGIFTSIAINNKDELYVVGVIKNDSLKFENRILKATEGNLFIAKYNCLNELLWIKNVGSTASTYGINGCVIDSLGNIVFDVDVANTVMFIKPNGDTIWCNVGDGSVLAKYSAEGEYIFHVPIHLKNNQGECLLGYNINQGVQITNDNKILIAGRIISKEKSEFFVGNSSEVINSSKSFFARISENGIVDLLHVSKDSLLLDMNLDATSDNWGNIYVVSKGRRSNNQFEGLDFKPVYGNQSFIAKYNKFGQIKWVKSIGCETDFSFINNIRFENKSGNLVFCYGGLIHFDNGDTSLQSVIQYIDTLGNWGTRFKIDGGDMFMFNKNGDIFTSGVDVYNENGDLLKTKKYKFKNFSYFDDFLINSKNEIFLSGNSIEGGNKLDSFSLGSGKGNFFLAKLSYKFPIQNTKPIFTIYPNPAKTQILIQSQNNLINQVRIIDVLGKNVLEFFNENSKNNFTIDINALQTGKYFVQAISGKETSVQQLLVH